MRSVPKLAALISFFGLLGCGTPDLPLPHISALSTSCTASNAAIGVGDGFMQTLCGCTGAGETAGTTFPVSGATQLTCHVASSASVVFIHFIGTSLKHQVVPVNPSTGTGTPLHDPRGSNPLRSFAISVPLTATTYQFQEIYSGMNFQVVTP